MKTLMLGLSAAALALATVPALAQQDTTTTTVVTKKGSAGAGVGVVGGAAAGAAVGGPVGAVIGGVVGGVAGAAVDPPARVKTYIHQQKVAPITYDGQIVVGATLPETMTFYDIPRYERYRWTFVNDQRVLIDRRNHKIVAILD
jgi:hypothetical protein